MESGLEDRNNFELVQQVTARHRVSMESGLEDRNNHAPSGARAGSCVGLNGVRPRRPEQSERPQEVETWRTQVSMESGLEDRNNRRDQRRIICRAYRSQWSPA